MFETCNFLILIKNLEHILSCNLIRTKLCSESEPVTRGRDLCTHLKWCYFPIFNHRQSTLHASTHTSCSSPFYPIIIVPQSYPSPFHPAFQNSAFPHFLAHHNIPPKLQCESSCVLPQERKKPIQAQIPSEASSTWLHWCLPASHTLPGCFPRPDVHTQPCKVTEISLETPGAARCCPQQIWFGSSPHCSPWKPTIKAAHLPLKICWMHFTCTRKFVPSSFLDVSPFILASK